MELLKKYGGYAALILAALFASGIGKIVGRSTAENYYESKDKAEIEKAQEKVAASIRRQLPMKVDEATTLQNVVSVGTNLTYHYIISQNLSDIDIENFKDNMNTHLKHNICDNEVMSKSIKAGAIYLYQYVSQDGLSIAGMKLDKKACGFE